MKGVTGRGPINVLGPENDSSMRRLAQWLCGRGYAGRKANGAPVQLLVFIQYFPDFLGQLAQRKGFLDKTIVLIAQYFGRLVIDAIST